MAKAKTATKKTRKTAKKSSAQSSQTIKKPQTWPELAAGMWDYLTGHKAQINYHFDHLEVRVPAAVNDDKNSALWKLNGTLSITTRERQ